MNIAIVIGILVCLISIGLTVAYYFDYLSWPFDQDTSSKSQAQLQAPAPSIALAPAPTPQVTPQATTQATTQDPAQAPSVATQAQAPTPTQASTTPTQASTTPTQAPEPAPTQAPTSSSPKDWVCLNNINVPVRINSQGDVECMSQNSRDCLWKQTANDCQAILSSPPNDIKPLACGAMHQKEWGATGYHDAGHWCSRAKFALV